MEPQSFLTPDATAARAFELAGFFILEDLISPEWVQQLRNALPEDVAGQRNILRSIPEVMELARCPEVTSLLRSLTGQEISMVPVRGLFFDKNPKTNWGVPWHQDLAIAVRERREVSGFGPWSVKAGVVHAHAPTELLERMVTLRLHLDDCDSQNGALRVIPSSHRLGRFCGDPFDRVSRSEERVCQVRTGGVVAMRPMLLHASSPAATPGHRRVVHLEFSGDSLPGGLEWA